jgi:hypothetical protein
MFSAKMSALVLMALTASVSAHCGTQPALGVPGGTITKADVQRVVAGANCGKTDVASTIDSSVAVPAAADGTFTVTANSFDPGSDGSSLMTATLDTTGTGKAFPATVDITKNGNAVQPTSASQQQIDATLPAGTKCTGGAAGNLCLVAFKTSAGFQNCVVVSQGGATASTAAAGNATAPAASDNAAASTNATAVASTTATNGTAATGATGATAATKGAKKAGAKKVKKVKLTAAQKAAKKAAKAAKKAAKAAGTAAAPPPAAAAAPPPAAAAAPPPAAAAAPPPPAAAPATPASKRSFPRAALAARYA